jgi:hypothetical protein
MASQIDTSDISENLMLLIGPVSEDEADLIDAMNVCTCITEAAKSDWTPEQYRDFSIELASYAAELQATMTDMDKLIQYGPPRKSDSLQAQLKLLAPYVIRCEEQVGTRVEF